MFHLEPCNDRDFAWDERSRRTVQLSFASLNSASRSFISCEIPGHRTALRETFVYCTTPIESLLCTRLWELNRWEAAYCCNGRAVSYHSQQCVWCHNNFALRISVDLRGLIAHKKLFCEWNTRYIRFDRARWLYLAKRNKKNEILLIQGTRFLSFLFDFVDIRGVVQNKWLMVLICAMVQYFAFGERLMFYSTRLRPPPPPPGFASLNRTSIFHLMRNLVPLHDQPLAICVPFHDHDIVPPTISCPCVKRTFWVIIHKNPMCVAQSAACAVQ